MRIQFKKFQNGGAFAPFLASFSPTLVNKQSPNAFLATVANMQSKQDQAEAAKAKSSDTSKDTMELVKGLKGLDNDVAVVTSQLSKQATYDSAFGTGGTAAAYYRTLNLVNKVIEAKEDYKETFDIAKSNKTLSEAAISSDGRVVMRTANGYQMVTPKQAIQLAQSGKAAICRNSDLLSDRRHNPNMAFDNSVLDVVKNGVSFDSIKNTINAIASNLGSSTTEQDGYAYRQGNQIAKGIQAIKEAGVGPMDGVYKQHYKSKTQQAQAQMAVDAIYRNLNSAQRSYLMLNSDGTQNGAYGLIKEIVMGKTSSEVSFTSSYMKNMNLDGSAKSSKTDQNGNPIKDVDTDPAVQFASGYGKKDHFKLRTKGAGQVGLDMNVTSIAMLDASGHPLSTTTLEELGNGRLGSMGDISQASMNGVKINPNMANMIMLNGRVYETELPIDQEKAQQGIITPDLALIEKIEKVNQEQLGGLANIPQDKLTNVQKQAINQIYAENGLEAKYDSSGKLSAPYRRFMMVAGEGSETALQGNDLGDSELFEVGDSASRDAYNQGIRRFNKESYKDYKLDNGFFGMGGDTLYQGTVFIPMSDNFVDYYTGSGIKMDANEAQAMNRQQQTRDYIRQKYNNPGNLQM